MAYSADPTLFLYTSLTAGSSHIITATSRLETILKANKIPFRAIDCATDEKARMLWGRRSKGRKLPGLVRFGAVVGDLDQIEEWNELGELKDQINATENFGTGATPTSTPSRPTTLHTTSLQPEQAMAAPRSPSNASSRASSQGRHIFISEPTAEEKKRDASPAPTSDPKARSPSTDSPQNLIVRQLGAEAAMKATSRKTSNTKAAPVPASSASATSTTQTSTAASAKEQEATHPSQAPEMTSAKTPAMLAAEGKTKMSTDKIEEHETSPASTSGQGSSGHTSENEEKSTEEQLLELRRSSTQARQPSRLSEATPVEESHFMLPDQNATGGSQVAEPQDKTVPDTQGTQFGASLVPEDTAAPTQSTTSGSNEGASASMPPPERRRSFHRGSSVEEADISAIHKAEAATRIQEEEMNDDSPKRDDGVDAEAQGIRQRARVGIGMDTASMDTASDEPVNEDPIFAEGEPTKEAERGGTTLQSMSKDEVKDIDTAKDNKIKVTDIKLPTGKLKDVEGKDMSMKPQDTKAAEMEDASVSVGD